MSKDGIISIPQPILDQLGWKPGDIIAACYIDQPLTLLFRPSLSGRAAFKLSYLSRSGLRLSGGKLNCRGFAKKIVRPRIPLPRIMSPAYLRNGTFQLALMLENPQWTTVEFSMAGCQSMPSNTSGVYQLLGNNSNVLRIGEGMLQQRIRDHLRDDEMVSLVRSARFMPMSKEDAVILEKVFLALHETEFGELPHFNLMRSYGQRKTIIHKRLFRASLAPAEII